MTPEPVFGERAFLIKANEVVLPVDGAAHEEFGL
jgi:hypothetical protein